MDKFGIGWQFIFGSRWISFTSKTPYYPDMERNHFLLLSYLMKRFLFTINKNND